VNLLGYWQTEPYMYQLWDDDYAFVLECIDTRTLETICMGEGNTPAEAIQEGIRKALRKIS
jgi:hypothetical protein